MGTAVAPVPPRRFNFSVKLADGPRLCVSLANLTEYAFTINMELGVLITGGRLPNLVEEHVGRPAREAAEQKRRSAEPAIPPNS